MNNNTLKTCSKCKKEKPATTDYFGKMKSSKDGLNSSCIPCYKEYMQKYNKKHYKENKEYYNKKSKKWAENNRQRMLELQREWYYENYPKNKEKENERSKKYFENNPDYRRKYYLKNKDKQNKATKKWHENNKDKHREMNRKWHRVNKEKSMLLVSRYQHQKKNLPFNFTIKDWNDALSYFGNSCAYCGEKSERLQKEHFIPVSKGGGFVKDNIIPACPSCNMSKKNDDFEVWYKTKEFYSEARIQKIYKYFDLSKEPN